MWVQDNMALTIYTGYGSLQKKNIQTAKKPKLECQPTGRMSVEKF
jgi:hypothetical protein